jgi:hypothetical protein
LKKQIYDIFGYISRTNYYGIELDVVAHLIVGVLIFLIAKKYVSTKMNLLIILGIALVKEIHDTQVMTNTFQENIKDLFVTLLVPVLLISYRAILLKFRNFTKV